VRNLLADQLQGRGGVERVKRGVLKGQKQVVRTQNGSSCFEKPRKRPMGEEGKGGLCESEIDVKWRAKHLGPMDP